MFSKQSPITTSARCMKELEALVDNFSTHRKEDEQLFIIGGFLEGRDSKGEHITVLNLMHCTPDMLVSSMLKVVEGWKKDNPTWYTHFMSQLMEFDTSCKDLERAGKKLSNLLGLKKDDMVPCPCGCGTELPKGIVDEINGLLKVLGGRGR